MSKIYDPIKEEKGQKWYEAKISILHADNLGDIQRSIGALKNYVETRLYENDMPRSEEDLEEGGYIISIVIDEVHEHPIEDEIRKEKGEKHE